MIEKGTDVLARFLHLGDVAAEGERELDAVEPALVGEAHDDGPDVLAERRRDRVDLEVGHLDLGEREDVVGDPSLGRAERDDGLERLDVLLDRANEGGREGQGFTESEGGFEVVQELQQVLLGEGA